MEFKKNLNKVQKRETLNCKILKRKRRKRLDVHVYVNVTSEALNY